MNKKDDLIPPIAFVILMLCVIMMLFSFCIKLIRLILNTFVYLTGLITILIAVAFFICIILFCFNQLFKHCRSYKRCVLTVKDVFYLIVKSEMIILINLSIMYTILFVLCRF